MKLQRCLFILLWLSIAIAFVQAAPEPDALETIVREPASATALEGRVDKADASKAEEAVGDLLLQAMSLLGVAYRFGGSTPDNGLDCSGFIRYIFQKSLRVNLPRTAVGMARVGKSVYKSELTPGDLVFFNTRGFNYSHVGLYVGGGKFIHAPRTGRNIEVASMNQSYWSERYNGARRVNQVTALLAADMSDDMHMEANTRQQRMINPIATVRGRKCHKGRKCKIEWITIAPKVKKKGAKGKHAVRLATARSGAVRKQAGKAMVPKKARVIHKRLAQKLALQASRKKH